MPNWGTTYGAQGNVGLNFNPRPVYQPWQTAHAVNQQVADQTPDANYAQKAFDGRGMSRSAGTLSAAMPAMSRQLSAGLLGSAAQPMEDYIANQQNMFSGEVNRSGMANRMGGLLNTLQGTQNQYNLGSRNNQLTQQGQMLSLLQALLGSG